jgi:tetratricopeptide (TPR) repeat protein
MASLVVQNARSERTLVSWKEIAVFLNRAERTVKRWEQERGLPVHRVPGGERGSVFAYPSELNAWLLGEQNKASQNGSITVLDLDHPNGSDSGKGGWLKDAELESAPADLKPAAHRKSIRNHRWLVFTPALALVLGIAVTSWHFFSAGRKIHAAELRSAAGIPGVADQNSTPRAEQLYLQGRYEWGLRTADGLVKSIDDYTQAIVQDSNYAPAYAGLAESYDLLPEYGRLSREEAFPRARAAADKAISLDPNLAAGHRARAFALFYGDWDVPASDAEFKLALALAPNEMESHHWYATTLFSRLDAAQAITEIDQAVRLSPTSPAVVADAAFIHVFFDSDREANLRTLRELAQTQPKLASTFRYLAEIDLENEDYPNYLDDLRHAAAVSRDPYEESLAAAASHGWVSAGKTGLLEGVRQVQQKAFDQGKDSGYWLGRTYLSLGQSRQALRYFNHAFQKNDFALMTLPACPCMAGLKNDSGYADLLHRVHQRMYK